MNVVSAFLADTAVFSSGVCKKMLPPGALFELKIYQNAYAAGASPRTPLEKLTELLNHLAGFQGIRGRGGEERGR